MHSGDMLASANCRGIHSGWLRTIPGWGEADRVATTPARSEILFVEIFSEEGVLTTMVTSRELPTLVLPDFMNGGRDLRTIDGVNAAGDLIL